MDALGSVVHLSRLYQERSAWAEAAVLSLLVNRDSTAGRMMELGLKKLWMLEVVRDMKLLAEVLTFVAGIAELE